MKKFLLSLTLLGGMSLGLAQNVIFEDNFESYTDFAIDGIGDWIMIDGDGSTTYSFSGEELYENQFVPKAFMVFNPFAAGAENVSGAINANFDQPDDELFYMACWASVTPANNDWMVSPAITLGASNNVLEFMHKSLSDSYGYETFAVHVYVGDGVPTMADFTLLEGGLTSNSWASWLNYSKNLDAYAGQTIRIAIQCTSNDAYMFMVDNFKVTTGSMAVSDLNKSVSALYPNPVADAFQVNLSSKFDANNVKVTISDLTGKSVRTFGKADSYNVSDLAAGVYVVTITDGKTTETKKVVKK